jgi:hypothetical protein
MVSANVDNAISLVRSGNKSKKKKSRLSDIEHSSQFGEYM